MYKRREEKRREPAIARECLRRETTTTSFQSLPPFASCERICYIFKKSKTDLALPTSAIQLTRIKLGFNSMLFINKKRWLWMWKHFFIYTLFFFFFHCVEFRLVAYRDMPRWITCTNIVASRIKLIKLYKRLVSLTISLNTGIMSCTF